MNPLLLLVVCLPLSADDLREVVIAAHQQTKAALATFSCRVDAHFDGVAHEGFYVRTPQYEHARSQSHLGYAEYWINAKERWNYDSKGSFCWRRPASAWKEHPIHNQACVWSYFLLRLNVAAMPMADLDVVLRDDRTVRLERDKETGDITLTFAHEFGVNRVRLAAAKNYLPVHCHSDHVAFTTETTLSEFQELVPGLFFPTRGDYVTTYKKARRGDLGEALPLPPPRANQIRISRWSTDPHVAATYPEFAPPQGMQVLDQIDQISYRVGLHGVKLPITSRSGKVLTLQAGPTPRDESRYVQQHEQILAASEFGPTVVRQRQQSNWPWIILGIGLVAFALLMGRWYLRRSQA